MAKDTNSHGSRFDRAVAVFKNHGGIIHTAQALRSGIHPDMLLHHWDSGVLEMVTAARITEDAENEEAAIF